MRVTARRGRTNTYDPFLANTQSFQAAAVTEIMLKTFEAELDSLDELIRSDRKAASTEALLRRYMTAEEIYRSVEEDFRRIQLKMLMLSDRLSNGRKGVGDGK